MLGSQKKRQVSAKGIQEDIYSYPSLLLLQPESQSQTIRSVLFPSLYL